MATIVDTRMGRFGHATPEYEIAMDSKLADLAPHRIWLGYEKLEKLKYQLKQGVHVACANGKTIKATIDSIRKEGDEVIYRVKIVGNLDCKADDFVAANGDQTVPAKRLIDDSSDDDVWPR